MLIPILHSLLGYVVFQIQVVAAICATTEFDWRNKRRTVMGSALYWGACICLMAVAGIADYVLKLYYISYIRIVMAWVFAVLWQALFLKGRLLDRAFSFFCGTIVLLSGNAFCNIVNGFCREYDLGALNWLQANDRSLGVVMLMTLRSLALYLLIWGVEYGVLRRYIGKRWSTVVNKTVVFLYAFLALIMGTLFWLETHALTGDFWYYMAIFCCEFAYSIMAISLVVILELKIRSEQFRLRTKSELDLTRRLWQMEKKQYAFLKENVEAINLKCHNMRHYINMGDAGTTAVKQELGSLSDSISAYDSMVRTGNTICDVALSSKSLECMRKGIDLICIVDGAALQFMDEVSLYSLLGNALENAIEHVERMTDPDKRQITLNVSRKGAMVVINVENALEGELVIEDGLPKTSKADSSSHGFGMMSMRRTAEQFGGEMEAMTEDGIFRLVIVLPYRERELAGAEA